MASDKLTWIVVFAVLFLSTATIFLIVAYNHILEINRVLIKYGYVFHFGKIRLVSRDKYEAKEIERQAYQTWYGHSYIETPQSRLLETFLVMNGFILLALSRRKKTILEALKQLDQQGKLTSQDIEDARSKY